MWRDKIITINYKNWKGNTRDRKILPTGKMFFGTTEYHTTPQWLIEAYDIESITPTVSPALECPIKIFALAGIIHIYE